MHTQPFTTTEAERARVVEKRRARRLAHLAPELVAALRDIMPYALSRIEDIHADIDEDAPRAEDVRLWTIASERYTRAETLLAGIDSDLPTEDATVKRLADTLRHISCNIGAFEQECKRIEHTDTDEAWALFNRIRNWCRSALRK
jgi:hypothetical protein